MLSSASHFLHELFCCVPTGLLGTILFDSVTGINIAPAETIEQVQANGTYSLIANQSSAATTGLVAIPLAYPYDWPWQGIVHAGDVLHRQQNSGLAILGVVISVLGAWVAQIIVEQSIFVKRKGGWYRSWLLVVALALGAVSIWCAILMSASALTTSKPGIGGPLDISFAFDVALLTWLPSILLTWCGLMVLMGDVESTAVQAGSRASQAQQILREQKEAKKKKAALSNRAHFHHLLAAISWRAVVGGMLVAAAIAVTRASMWYLWVQDASFQSAGWSWAVTTVFNVLAVPLAMLMYFHALRWRVAAVFLFAACVILDYQVQLQGLTFYYAPGHQYLTSTLLTANVDAAIVNLIAGIIAAFICFIFIGLQFSRMRLSRNGLSVLVASLEALINKQKDQLRAEAEANHQLRSQLTAALRLVEHINIVTPIATEYAFAMASSTQLETFQALYALPVVAGLAGMGRPSHAPSVMASGRGSSGSVVDKGGKALGVSRVSNNSRHQPSKQFLVDEMAELAEHSSGNKRGSEGVDAEATTKPQLEGAQSGLPLILPPAEQPEPERALRLMRSASHKVAPAPVSARSSGEEVDKAEAEDTVEDGLTLPSSVSNVVQAAISPRRKAAETSGDSTTVSGTAFTTRKSSSKVLSSSQSNSGPANVLNQPLGPASPMSSSGNSRLGSSNRVQQYRTNEDELTAAMDAQLAYKESLALAAPKAHSGSVSAVSPKARKIGGIGGTSPAEDCSFDLAMPLLGHRTAENAQPSTAAPTLQMLLSHPICVEVLKAELQAIHSVENLIFYLHATRYRHVQSPKLRKLLATAIHEHFIREAAPQQININTRQRDAITVAVTRKGSDECSAELFKEAEREVLQLMETNVMKAMSGTSTVRLCAWVLATMPMGAVTSAERMGADRWNGKESSALLSDVKSSLTAARESVLSDMH